MKRDIATEPGIGFAVFVAAGTFAVAVAAGILLIWESGGPSSARFGAQGQSQILLSTSDLESAARTGRSSERNAGFDPAPVITQ